MVVWRLRVKKSITSSETGSWWTAVSSRPACDIHRMFRKEQVAGILYEAVGRVEPTPRVQRGQRVVRLKLTYPSHPTDQALLRECLGEIGVTLLNAETTEK